MKYLDAVIRSKTIQHNDDPIMTWMISNVVAKTDAKDNVYPRKERDENKIDGVIALIMALSRCMNDNEADISAAIFDNISVNV
jgi:phage terminase large subunit-like protein